MSDLVDRLAKRWHGDLLDPEWTTTQAVEDARWWLAAIAEELECEFGFMYAPLSNTREAIEWLRSQIQTPDSEKVVQTTNTGG